ncbi:predicted protein, partial [Nematostella vectensis]
MSHRNRPVPARSTYCAGCNTSFSVFFRPHHCRSCGGSFCEACSSKRMTLPRLGYDTFERVCDACYHALQNPNL